MVLEALKSYLSIPITLILKHSPLYGKTDIFTETADMERPTWRHLQWQSSQDNPEVNVVADIFKTQ